ncbi:hypothetical protein ACVOMS_26120 [Bradyrhizobium guangxiense]
MLRDIGRETLLLAAEFDQFLQGNWFQRSCPTLVSFGGNDDRNHIDERQLNGVE